MTSIVEHVNVTVSDPDSTAAFLGRVFGWKVRWSGDSDLGGRSVHVGLPHNGASYLAIYRAGSPKSSSDDSYATLGGLNHIGVVVDDLSEVEKRVLAEGLETYAHGDYEPGRRFYFEDADGIEFEVVSYAVNPD